MAGKTEKPSEHESAYMRIYNRLKKEITDGVLKKGDRLPSRRMMALECGVSVITVDHAYALLADEEYIIARPRSGFYVYFSSGMPGSSGRALSDKAASAIEPIRDAPSDFPFSVYARIMRRVINDYGSQILTKSPGQGLPELREAIADYLRRTRSINVASGQIIVGSGAEYLYGLIVQLLGRETLFALESPSYEKIRKVYESNGAVCTLLRLGQDGILSEELADCRAGALHVTPFHSFPSGVTASPAKRHEYASWAKAGNARIIEDDYDGEFATLRREVDTIFSLAPKHVIYVNTFSKTIAPAMRMGYMVLPADLAARYTEKLGFLSCTVPVFEQYVLASFIRQGHLERYINQRRRRKTNAPPQTAGHSQKIG